MQSLRLLKDIEYENGADEKRAMSLSWHSHFGLVNISFYRNRELELIFAEDFDLQTAIELRKQLGLIIESATKNGSPSAKMINEGETAKIIKTNGKK